MPNRVFLVLDADEPGRAVRADVTYNAIFDNICHDIADNLRRDLRIKIEGAVSSVLAISSCLENNLFANRATIGGRFYAWRDR